MPYPHRTSVNPYQSPPLVASLAANESSSRPRRTAAVWVTTGVTLLSCCIAAGVASYVALLWAGTQMPVAARWLPKGTSIGALGAGSINILLMAAAVGFGQIRASFYFDSIWARTIAWLLLIEAGVLFSGAFLLDWDSGPVTWLIWPALAALAMGVCMYDWCNRLFAAKVEHRRRHFQGVA